MLFRKFLPEKHRSALHFCPRQWPFLSAFIVSHRFYVFFYARFHTGASRLINRETAARLPRDGNEENAYRGKVRHIRLTFESHELLRLCSIETVIFQPLKRFPSAPSTFLRYIRRVKAHQRHRETEFPLVSSRLVTSRHVSSRQSLSTIAGYRFTLLVSMHCTE